MNQRVTLSTEFNLIILKGIFIIKQVNLLKKKKISIMNNGKPGRQSRKSFSLKEDLFRFVYQALGKVPLVERDSIN